MGEFQIELRHAQRGLRRGEIGLGRGGFGLQPFEFAARDRVLGDQPLAALAVGAGHDRFRLGALDLGGQPVDLGLERPGIDLEQHVALLDLGAILEADLVDEAADPRPDLDRVDRLQMAGHIVPLAQVLDHHAGDLNLGRRRRRRGGLRLGFLAASGEKRGTEQNGGGLNGGTEAHGEFLGRPLDRGRQ